MKFSLSSLLVMMTAVLITTSCNVVTEDDQTAIFLEKLQRTKWVLSQDIVYDNSIDFTPQTFEFISDSELIFSYEDNNGLMKTETHDYYLDFQTYRNIQFNINITSAGIVFPVAAITNNSMTVIFENGRMLEFY